ncbi:MAG TPA: NfeD family protein [Anaerolineae bacterium]|nr:NfeD family protein [Anaerolineae bacterium]
MTMDIYFWGWLILALIFFVGEMFTAGFFLAAFGVGAALAALAALFGLNIVWQLAIFTLASAIALFLSRRFAESVTPPQQPVNVGIDRVLGKMAVVIEPVNAVQGTGIVRVDMEEWRAVPEDPSITIPTKSIVEIVAVEGTRLVVRPVEGTQRPGTDDGESQQFVS